MKYEIPVFTMTGQRNPEGSHSVTIETLEIPTELSANEQKVEVLKRYNLKMGEIVSNCPEQYFWYHRRWREESEETSS